MSNYLEYILSLKDQMSAGLKSIGITSGQALNRFAQLEKQSNEVNAAMKAFGGSVGALKMKLDLLKNERDWLPAGNLKTIKQYTQEINKLEKEIGKLENAGKGGGIGGSLLASVTGGNLLSQGITAAVGFIKDGISDAVKYAADIQQQRLSFGIMTGSEQAGNKLVNDLQQMANVTPFETRDLTKNAQLLLSFGEDAKKIIPDLQMLGDVSAGNAEKLNSLALAFAQTKSAGRLMGQDLLQYINAGFNPLQEISKMTGISMGVLKKRMEDGAISAEMVGKAFEHATGPGGRFFNMMQKQATTDAGRWITILDNWHQGLQHFGEAVHPATNALLSFMEAIVGVKNVTAAQRIQEQINKINALKIELFNVNTPLDRHKQILEELKSINPDIVKGIDAQATSYDKLQKNIDNVTEALLNKKAIAALDEENIKSLTKWTDYEKSIEDTKAKIIAKMASAAPDVIKPGMSFGQQQLAVIAELQKRVDASPNKQSTTTPSGGGGMYGNVNQYIGPDLEALTNIKRSISEFNKLTNDVGQYIPQLQAYNKQSAALKTALGIATPVLPGQGQTVNTKMANEITNGGTGSKSNGETVATGGTKSYNIHIAIGKQIENLTVVSNNLREGAGKIRDIIVDEMTRALAMSQAVGQ